MLERMPGFQVSRIDEHHLERGLKLDRFDVLWMPGALRPETRDQSVNTVCSIQCTSYRDQSVTIVCSPQLFVYCLVGKHTAQETHQSAYQLLRGRPTESDCDAGGDFIALSRAFGPSGRKTIRDFVAGGGGYVGVCSGAHSLQALLRVISLTSLKESELRE